MVDAGIMISAELKGMDTGCSLVCVLPLHEEIKIKYSIMINIVSKVRLG